MRRVSYVLLVLLLLLAEGGIVWAQRREEPLRRAPSFDLPLEGGGRLRLDDLRGRIILLVFFKPG